MSKALNINVHNTYHLVLLDFFKRIENNEAEWTKNAETTKMEFWSMCEVNKIATWSTEAVKGETSDTPEFSTKGP